MTFAPFNPAAAPFEPPPKKYEQIYPTINIGPSQLPVNGKIWETIANNRPHPTIPQAISRSLFSPQLQIPVKLQPVQPIQPSPAYFAQNNVFAGYVSAEKLKFCIVIVTLFSRIIRRPSKTPPRVISCSPATSDPSPTAKASSSFVCAKASGELTAINFSYHLITSKN